MAQPYQFDSGSRGRGGFGLRGGFAFRGRGFGPHGAGFGPRGGGFGPRFGFGHHHHFHPYAFPHDHEHEEEPLTPDVEDTEEGKVEIADEVSTPELDEEGNQEHCKKDKRKHHDFKRGHFKKCKKIDHHECKRGHCKKDKIHKHSNKHVLKNSIDPVWTTVENKEGKFIVSVVIGREAKPEDIRLYVRERDLFIEIKMVKWSEDRTSVLSQVFTKKVALPEQVNGEEITSNLTPEGILKIEASVPVPVPEVITVPLVVSVETETTDLEEN